MLMTWQKSVGIPDAIDVCKGAQVMITRNNEEQEVVNGTRGVVESWDGQALVLKLMDGRRLALPKCRVAPEDMMANDAVGVFYWPVCLAWALTVHRAQGATLDAVELDLGDGIFEAGQAYTALSRARSLANVRLLNVKRKSFWANAEVVAFYKKYK